MGKSKELAELGDVVTQSGGNVGIGTSSPENFAGFTTQTINGSTGSVLAMQAGGVGNTARFVKSASLFSMEAISAIPLLFSTNNTERMRIDASGRVTMPYQVCGMAVGNSSSAVAHSTGYILDFFQSTYSTGGVSFSNNGRWTVPVAGRYLINFAVYAYPSVSNGARHIAIALNQNGSLATYEQWEFTGYAYDSRNDHHISTSYIANASANDYFDLELYTDTSTDLYHGSNNNRFQIYLLG